MRACGALNLGPTFPSLTHVELITRCYITWRHPGPSSFIDSQRLELRRWIWCFNSMAIGGTKVNVMMTSLCIYGSSCQCDSHSYCVCNIFLNLSNSDCWLSCHRNHEITTFQRLAQLTFIYYFLWHVFLRYFFNGCPRFFIWYVGRSMCVAMHCNILRCQKVHL